MREVIKSVAKKNDQTLLKFEFEKYIKLQINVKSIGVLGGIKSISIHDVKNIFIFTKF